MLIECSNIKKSFQGIGLLKDISFKVDDHDKIAIIGVNGAGKTTILNILIGEESYDSGDLFKSRDLNVGYLKQHHDLDMNKTIYECALEVFEPLIKIENRMRELESIMAYDHSDQVMNEYDSLTNRFNEKDGFSYPSRIVGVLKGMPKAFSAGGDIGYFYNLIQQGGEVNMDSLISKVGNVTDGLKRMSKLVISSVSGAAAGAGVSLAFS